MTSIRSRANSAIGPSQQAINKEWSEEDDWMIKNSLKGLRPANERHKRRRNQSNKTSAHAPLLHQLPLRLLHGIHSNSTIPRKIHHQLSTTPIHPRTNQKAATTRQEPPLQSPSPIPTINTEEFPVQTLRQFRYQIFVSTLRLPHHDPTLKSQLEDAFAHASHRALYRILRIYTTTDVLRYFVA